MGQWINEEETLKFAKLTQDIFTQFTYYAIKMGLALWFGLYEKVVEYGDECKKYLTPGVFINPVFHFMHAVALTATYPDMSPEQQIIRRKQIDYYMDRINLWAKNCPTTYTHMQSIVQAGLAWIDGDDGKATLLIDKAIESALENNFIQNAAVAAEFGGRFTLRRGQPKAIGRAYIDEAIQYFNNWGATGRVALMKSDYKDILKRRILKTGS